MKWKENDLGERQLKFCAVIIFTQHVSLNMFSLQILQMGVYDCVLTIVN